MPEDRDARPGAPRPQTVRDRLGLDLGEPRGRPVDLEHLPAGVLQHELCGRPGRDRLAVGHDHHRVGEALRLLDVVRRHQDRRALRSAARRSAPRAPAAPAGRGRPSARRAARAAAGGRARVRSAGAAACRRRACRRGVSRRSTSLAICERALDRRARARRGRSGRGARRRAGSARPSASTSRLSSCGTTPHCARADLRLAGQLEAEHLELALVGDRLRGEQPHRRRLPRAVRPEQADARALRHVEVEPVDGGDRAVALDDAAQADGERRSRRSAY